MLGGRLSVSAATEVPAARTAPPAAAALLRKKRRRVVLADFSSVSIVLLIAGPRLKLKPHETFHEVHLQFAAVSKTGDFDQD
jgi:hypothetical protein